MELEFNQVSVYSVVKWDIWPGIVQIEGHQSQTCFWQLCGDDRRQRCFFAGSYDDSTARNCTILRFQQVSRARRNLAESFGSCGTVPFSWCHQPVLSSAKPGCSVGTQTEPQSIPPPSPTQQRSPRTVLITENGMKSTKVFHSSTVCSTLNRSMKVTSFRRCTQCPTPSVGVFAEWAALRWRTSKAMRCWTLEHPDQLEVT